MGMVKKFLLLILLLFSISSVAQSLLLQSKWDNGYKETRFHHVLDQIFALAEPLVQSQGGKLRFYRDWSDGAVNWWPGYF